MASFTVPKGVAVPVTAKGTKGFLAWLALNQGPIYDKIAPQLKQMAAAEAQSAPVKPALSGLGQFDDSSGDISVDNSGDATDFSSTLDSSVPPAPTASQSLLPPTVTFPPDSTVAAASTAPTPASTAAQLSAIIGVAASAATAAQQITTQQQLTNIQLQRAQAGLPPLNINPASLGLANGVTTTLASLPMSTILLIGGGLLALAVLFGGKKS
jgi:hypothetical protein